MATPGPTTGPSSSAPSPDQLQWLQDSRTKIEQSRPLAAAVKVRQFREIVNGRTLHDLQELSREIVSNPSTLTLSQIEERELAVRVRELLPPNELRELLESRDIARRLQLLEGRADLLQLVSRHLQPGPTSRLAGRFERAYQRVINAPNAMGDFFRRSGERLEKMGPSRRAAFANQMKKGFFMALEFPGMVSKFLPLPNTEFLSRFAHKFREKRTQIESEERVYMAINAVKSKQNRPFIEFQGFDMDAFIELKQKHMPKDAQGNVTSEDFTERVRVSLLRDVAQSTTALISNLTDSAKNGDSDLGKTEDKKITIAMRDLVNPNLIVEERTTEETNNLKERIIGTPAQPSAWGAAGTVKTVEFGTAYSFNRADGKLTLPREAVDANGAPTTDQGRTLQSLLTQLPATAKNMTVVLSGEPLILGETVQIPLNRAETPAQIATFLNQLQNLSKASKLRTIKSETMDGYFRYAGDSGKGVIEWNESKALLPDMQSFLSTAGILDGAQIGDQWQPKAGGGWEKIVRT